MDGLMLARWVGQNHPSVPVLVASGYGAVAAASVPRSTFFRKPYSPDRVVARIRSLLEQPGDG